MRAAPHSPSSPNRRRKRVRRGGSPSCTESRGTFGNASTSSRGRAGDDAAVAAADRLGKEHERVAARALLAPAAVAPRAHGHPALVANGVDARRAGPTGAGDADLVDALEQRRRVRGEHVGEPGRETATDRDRDARRRARS